VDLALHQVETLVKIPQSSNLFMAQLLILLEKELQIQQRFYFHHFKCYSILGLHKTKLRIEAALIQTLKDGIKTGDLGGKSNTKEFTKAIII
jgi:hypothetical protein